LDPRGPIGILSLQGDYMNHLEAFKAAGAEAILFRNASELARLSGVVIPGGESTTIGMLMERRGLFSALKEAASGGLPCLGTCAGAILLSTEIEAETTFSDGSVQPKLGLIPMRVLRNAYGSQVDSFEARLELRDPELGLSDDMDGVFIRAPRFLSLGPGVRVIAEFDGSPVMVRYGRIVACAFHPELSQDPSVHLYFARSVCGAGREA
jgi:5'-phosphate synthase pdxT subunit